MIYISIGILLGIFAGVLLCKVNIGVIVLLCFVLLLFLGNYCHKVDSSCKRNNRQWHTVKEAEDDPCVSDIVRKRGTPWYELTLLDETKIERKLLDDEN